MNTQARPCSTNTRRIFGVLLLSAAGLLATTPAPAHEDSDDTEALRKTGKAFARVASTATPAVVSILSEQTISARSNPHHYYNNPFDFFGDEFLRRYFHGYGTPQPRQFKQQGMGSGFLISRDGYILTNHHVVGDADSITVALSDGTEHDATLIGSDAESEVALIKIKGDNFPTIPLGDSHNLEIGEWVIAIGNPFHLHETVTVGVVSAKGRSVGIAQYEDFIQTDAAINPGNSGGPLLNIDGEVVGINTAIYSRSGGNVGIGFAIPIHMAINIKNQLLENDGKVIRGYLGVFLQEITKENAQHFGMNEPRGILISDVIPGSEAEKAGLEAGDVIIKLNDAEVASLQGFRNSVSSMQPGTELVLTLLKDGKVSTVEAKTGTMPGTQETAREATKALDKLGISVDDLSDEVAERLGYEDMQGVVITQVAPDGLGAENGLRPGDLISAVNRKDVTTVDEFNTAMAKAVKSGGSVLLRVRQGQFSRFVVISFEE